jgi:hypothetical protein
MPTLVAGQVQLAVAIETPTATELGAANRA